MADTTQVLYSYVDTPIGRALLTGRAGALTGLYVADHEGSPRPGREWVEDPAAFADARRQLDEYFAGSRRAFELPLELAGTPFQLAVWTALRGVEYGRTIGYGELAGRIGRPTAARAVGAANGSNPISIIIPCHRVIGADGSLTGYGWGTDRKAWLLAHERRHILAAEGGRAWSSSSEPAPASSSESPARRRPASTLALFGT